jgi:hypothetical protein
MPRALCHFAKSLTGLAKWESLKNPEKQAILGALCHFANLPTGAGPHRFEQSASQN